MWKFKNCPRCHGDILLDRDRAKWYETCLQCGYQRELLKGVEVQPQQAKLKKVSSNNG